MGSALRLVNRTLLALLGLLLFAGGGAALAAALGGFGAARAGQPVLTPAAWAGVTRPSWWSTALLAGAGAVFLAALAWLLGQVRRARRREVGLDELGGGEVSVVRSAALRDALTAALEDVPGVDRVAVRVAGRRRAPGVRVTLSLDSMAAPSQVAGAALAGPVLDLRRSLDRPDLPVELVLHARRPAPAGARRRAPLD